MENFSINIPESRIHKNYPSISWSRIFIGASCNSWP